MSELCVRTRSDTSVQLQRERFNKHFDDFDLRKMSYNGLTEIQKHHFDFDFEIQHSEGSLQTQFLPKFSKFTRVEINLFFLHLY